MLPRITLVLLGWLVCVTAGAAGFSDAESKFETSKCASVLTDIPILSVQPVKGAHIRDGAGRFGSRRNTELGRHVGVDITFPIPGGNPSLSVPVVAIGAGEVVYSRYNGTGDDNGYGYSVVIKHSAHCYSFYAHLAKPAGRLNNTSNTLRIGDKVQKGQAIGELYLNNQLECRGPEGLIEKVLTESNVHLHLELIENPIDVPANSLNNDLTLAQLFKNNGARWLNPESLLIASGYGVKADKTSKPLPCHSDGASETAAKIDTWLAEAYKQDISVNWPRVQLASIDLYEANEAKRSIAIEIGKQVIQAQFLSVDAVFDVEEVQGQAVDQFKQKRKAIAADIYSAADRCANEPSCVFARDTLRVSLTEVLGSVDPSQKLSLGATSVTGLLGSLASDGFSNFSDDVVKAELYRRLAMIAVSDATNRDAAIKSTAAAVLLSQTWAHDAIQKVNQIQGSAATLSGAIQQVRTANVSALSGFSEAISTFDGVLSAASDAGLIDPKKVRRVAQLSKTAQLGVQAYQMFSAASNPMAVMALAGSFGGGGLGRLGGGSGPDPAVMAALAGISIKLDELVVKVDMIIETQVRIMEQLQALDEKLVLLQNSVTAGFSQLQTSVTSLNYLVRDGLNSRRNFCDGMADAVSRMYSTTMPPGSALALLPETRAIITNELRQRGFTRQQIQTCFSDGFITQFPSRCSVAETMLLREDEELNTKYRKNILLTLKLAGKCSEDSCSAKTGSHSKDYYLQPDMALLLDAAGAITDNYADFTKKRSAFEQRNAAIANHESVAMLASRCSENTLPSIQAVSFTNILRSGAISVSNKQILATIDDFLSVAPAINGELRGMTERERVYEDLRLISSALHLIRTALGQQALADGDLAMEYVANILTKSDPTDDSGIEVQSPTWSALYEMGLGQNALFLENLGRHLVYRSGIGSRAYTLGMGGVRAGNGDLYQHLRKRLLIIGSHPQWPIEKDETTETVWLSVPDDKGDGVYMRIPFPKRITDDDATRTYITSSSMMGLLSRYVGLLRYQVVLKQELSSLHES